MKIKKILLSVIEYFSIIFILFLLSSCESPLKDTLNRIVEDYSHPTVAVTPENRSGIDKQTSIVITFSETMDISSLILGGTMPAESNGGTWSDTGEIPDSKLTLTPKTAWETGSGHILIIDCYDTDGYKMDQLILEYGVLNGIVYVHADDGDDGFPGTKAEPKKSISEAILLADEYYETAEVHVAAGVYNVDYSLGTHIIMREGISLFGGYSPDNWEVRDTGLYISKIKDNGSIISSDPVPDEDRTRAVECGTALTVTTVLDGFTIEAGGGSVSIAVNCADSNPEISGNIINGSVGDLSVGIRIKDCSPWIHDNNIDGGTGGECSLGIFTANSSAIIEDNIIHGGTSETTDGIFNQDSSPVIRNNIIYGGNSGDLGSNGILNWTSSPIITGNNIHGGFSYYTSTAIYNTETSVPVIRNNIIYGGDGSAGHTTYSFGIILEDSNGTVQNNTISGGDPGSFNASMSYAIELSRSNPEIDNNILFTSGGVERYGVFELGSGAHPTSFKNNDVSGCDSGLYAYWNGSMNLYYSDFSTVNTYLWAENNIAAVPDFEDLDGTDNNVQTMEDNNWDLSDICSVLITEGGIDLSAYFTDDMVGAARSAPWSIGAYEKD